MSEFKFDPETVLYMKDRVAAAEYLRGFSDATKMFRDGMDMLAFEVTKQMFENEKRYTEAKAIADSERG